MRLKAYDIFNVVLFSALITIGGYIHIPLPFNPVPITLQTMFTYLAGSILGGYLGALSLLVYLLMGLAGLPIFSGGASGFSVIIGPTGGYLGFIVGAFVIGKLVETSKDRAFLWFFTCMVAGTLAICLCGIIQLMNWAKADLDKALVMGVLPFIFGELVKNVGCRICSTTSLEDIAKSNAHGAEGRVHGGKFRM